MPDSVIIVSGGLDSTTLLYHLIKNEHRSPAVITFRYGQKHDKEIACATYHVEKLGIKNYERVDLSSFQNFFSASALVTQEIAIPDIDAVKGDSQPATYVPNRNMLFLAMAVAYAENLNVNTVYYGAQQQDMYGYWDTTREFVEQLNRVYALNRKNPVTIKAPFVNLSKADILRVGLKLGVDYSHTWSCYAGQDKACGTCPTCAERLAAFKAVGIPDPVPYAT